MNTIVQYTDFLIYTKNHCKCYYTKFENGINLITGVNTSGKSSILQALNYTFGINDERYKLRELLEENLIFRLNFTISYDNTSDEHCTIIRDDDSLFIKREGKPLESFHGISANNSSEHINLKRYISKLFNFDMLLLSDAKQVPAPIEAIFLPYYVSQDYGWVIPLKSFKGFEYYKKFKESFYDYYFNISNNNNEEEIYKIEIDISNLERERKFLENSIKNNKNIQIALLEDERYIEHAKNYIEEYAENRNELVDKEKKYVDHVNKIEHIKIQISILKKTKSLLNNESGQIPHTQEDILKLYQTLTISDEANEKISQLKSERKKLTAQLNSINKSLSVCREKIVHQYSLINDHNNNSISLEHWINNKVNCELYILSQQNKNDLNQRINEYRNKLNLLRTQNIASQLRESKKDSFRKTFLKYLDELEIPAFDDSIDIYRLSIFPQQGVELLKTLLAYHFAFNELLSKQDNIHRLPFCLDAIFKEDVDQKNKKLILEFIYKNKPADMQIICSIAASELYIIENYNKEIFSNNANIIKTSHEPRSLLVKPALNNIYLILETEKLLQE